MVRLLVVEERRPSIVFVIPDTTGWACAAASISGRQLIRGGELLDKVITEH
jgi:hypothetical protein